MSRGAACWNGQQEAAPSHPFGSGLWCGTVALCDSTNSCDSTSSNISREGSAPWTPRSQFAIATVGYSVLVLGGCVNSTYSNEVWRWDVRRRNWKIVSAHLNPEIPSHGNGTWVFRKWEGRGRHAASGGSTSTGASVVYVIGGIGPRHVLGDVWASDTCGRTWLCTSQKAPFGARCDPSIAVVPDHPLQVLVSGGFDKYGVPLADLWVGTEAGGSWSALEVPWLSRSAPSMCLLEDGRLLVLGGKVPNPHRDGMVLSAESQCFTFRRPPNNSSKIANNVIDADSETPETRLLPFNPKSVAVPGRGEIVALDDRGMLWFVAVGAPGTHVADWLWQRAGLQQRVAGKVVKAVYAGSSTSKLADVGMPALVLCAEAGVACTTDSELRRQLKLLGQIGRSLAARYFLPADLWEGRVLPDILPVRWAPPKIDSGS